MEKGFDITARMSKRLLAVTDMLKSSGSCRCAADVGCDHGYVSICLVQQGTADSVIAMDVRKGPLSMAEANIKEMGLDGRISARLSDGLKELGEGEADALVIAGMGGRLMMSILEAKAPASLGIKKAVLQPQSELSDFRKYIRTKGWHIDDEQVVLDDGKYYFPMLVSFSGAERFEDDIRRVRDVISDSYSLNDDDIIRLCDRYGVYNILKGDILLQKYLEHGREVALSIIATLDENTHKDRYNELNQELKDIGLILSSFGN